MDPSKEPRQDPRYRLADIMRRPEEEISLAEAALVIAATEYPDLDPSKYLGRLDAMAETLAERIGRESDPLKIIAGINHYLFEEQGFFGNADDYYDLRNSFLNEVLERKTGIPITLSTVYLEIAQRLRLPLVGVGMPGHFLVKHPYFEILIDPFAQGRILTEDECREQMERALGESVPFDRSYLDGVSKLHIVTRMLNNLRTLYLSGRQVRKALDITEMAMELHPESLDEVKQKVSLLMPLRRYSEALESITQYLEREPECEEADKLREMAGNLRKALALMN